MGALAPVTPWSPEDDLLLKNAVEAGASLEALAKGAVPFSRQFTIQELQDRWYSLLYDADVSAEASAHIVEIELSVSSLPKPNKSCVSKGKEWIPGKRKIDSVRNHYYAMRKRICNEPSVDFDFLLPHSGHVCIGNDGNFQEQLKINTEDAVENCMLGAPVPNGFALQERGFDIGHHAFPLSIDVPHNAGVHVTAHTYHEGHVESLVHDLPDDEIMDQECLYGFVENTIPVMVDKSSVGNEIGGQSFEHDNLHKDIPGILGENASVCKSCPGFQEMETSALSVGNLLETDEVKVKPLPTFDSMNNNNQGSGCSGFGGNHNFSSPISDCSASFHQLGYSSPLPLPIWRTIEDISAPVIIEGSLEDKQHCISTMDANKMNSAGYDVVHSESKLNDVISGDGPNGSTSTTISEGAFIELSNSLLNFANEDVLLYTDDERVCLDNMNSILLSSPNDVHQDDIHGSHDLKMSTVLDTCPVIPDGKRHGESDDIGDPPNANHDKRQNSCDLELNVPETSLQNIQSLKPEELTCCTLNTEDPDIPCNDDIVFPTESIPSFVSSASQHHSLEATSSFPFSKKEICDKQKDSERHVAVIIKEEQEANSEPPAASLMIGLLPLPEVGSKNPNDAHGVKIELQANDASTVASIHAGIVGEDPSVCKVVPVTTHCVPSIKSQEHIMTVELGRHNNFNSRSDSIPEKSGQGVDFSQNVVDGSKAEERLVTLKNEAPSHAQPASGDTGLPEPLTNLSNSDHEELYESDDDVPYFSDIEAMILDMDLVPCDQESYFTREASRYQYEDTKKAIVRLEQGARSYVQRAIASHGALAVFYGRHLKHYIKKTEVSLGRATEDVKVDIDLGREGRANKISRRQAIIKMEEDGSFYLKNLGKCSILVNSKEVAAGQCFNLTSSCLIEIRGMRFMFETNQSFASAPLTLQRAPKTRI